MTLAPFKKKSAAFSLTICSYAVIQIVAKFKVAINDIISNQFLAFQNVFLLLKKIFNLSNVFPCYSRYSETKDFIIFQINLKQLYTVHISIKSKCIRVENSG